MSGQTGTVGNPLNRDVTWPYIDTTVLGGMHAANVGQLDQYGFPINPTPGNNLPTVGDPDSGDNSGGGIPFLNNLLGLTNTAPGVVADPTVAGVAASGVGSSGGGSTASLLSSLLSSYGGGGINYGNVLSAVISYFGGKSAANAAMKLTPQEQALYNQMLAAGAQNAAFGKWAQTASQGEIQQSINYLNNITSGNRTAALQAAGPSITNIGNTARTSIQAGAQLAPRSGAGAEFLGSLPSTAAANEQAALTNAVNAGRTSQMQLGSNLASIGTAATAGGNQTAGTLLNFDANQRNQANATGAAAGASYYNLLKGILGGGGSTSTSPLSSGGSGSSGGGMTEDPNSGVWSNIMALAGAI